MAEAMNGWSHDYYVRQDFPGECYSLSFEEE